MYKRVLAPIDGSETSTCALDAALRIARESGAELVPLYVIDVPVTIYVDGGVAAGAVHDTFVQEGEHVSADALAKMQRANVHGAPRVVEVTVPGEDVAHCILQEALAMHADLVVMGTHGRRGFQRLVLGSVAERFVRLATCPVLLIPAASTAIAASQATSTPQSEKEST